MRRSLPYLGIARAVQEDPHRFAYAMHKVIEAMKSGASDEEVIRVVKEAKQADEKTIAMFMALR